MSNETSFPKALLSERKLKATTTRINLLQLIKDYNAAIPFSQIQKKFGDADRVTLYRTVQTLLDKGIIHKAHSSNDETYYALCGSGCDEKRHNHNHVHFQCTKCEQVSCQYLQEEISILLPNFQVDKIQVNLSGVCERCLN